MKNEFLIKKGTLLKYEKDKKYFFIYDKVVNVTYDIEEFIVYDIFMKNGNLRLQLINTNDNNIFDIFADDIGSKFYNDQIHKGKYYIIPCKYCKLRKENYFSCLILEKNNDLSETSISSNTRLFFDFDVNTYPILKDFFKNNIPNSYLKILETADNKEKEIIFKSKEIDKRITLDNEDDFFTIEGKRLDKEQIESAKYMGNHLVIAGAGAGKTLSIVGKIKYLLEREKVDPSQILVLSFTDKVVTELKERIGKITNKKIDILTFHKLGLKIFKSMKDYHEIDLNTVFKYTKKIMYTELLKSDLELASMMINFANGNYSSKEFYDEDRIKDLLNNINKITDNGEQTASVGALIACNLLYLYGIPYKYYIINSYYHYIKIDDKYNIYFTTFSNDSNDLSLKEVAYYNIPEKLYDFLEQQEYIFNEKYDYKYFLNNPREAKCYEELFESILQAYQITSSCDAYNDDFDFLIDNFCQNKPNCILFIEIFKRIKQWIIRLFEEQHQTDFSYMISGPANILKNNKCLPYKYVIVDEYQDISPARYNLLIEILKQNDGYLMAYGDDWQSIFSFAGSSNKFFMEFEKKLPNAKEFYLKNTYRNSQELINASKDFISLNPLQKSKDITSSKSIPKPFIIFNYQVSNMDSLIASLCYIKSRNKNKKVKLMILGRTNFSIDMIKLRPEFNDVGTDENNNIIYHYDNYDNIDIVFLTIHRSKGLEADYVFVTSVHSKMMPLNISKDKEYLNIINKLNEYEEEKEHEKYEGLPSSEERRLFYVALTRTKNNVFLSVPNNHKYIKESIFVTDLYNKNKEYIHTYNVDRMYEIPEEERCPICGGIITEVSKKGKIYRFCENKCRLTK